MEIVLKNTKSEYLEIFSLLDLDNIHETFKRFSSIKEPLEAKIFAVNESISSHQLSKLKNHFDKINICSLCIYSNNRDTIISGKSLTIDSAYIKEQEIIGDVNPGAIVSAKKNIYVWGKLLGIAFAGKSGNKNASIASLYLNPLQLRIADVIAIGPKDKPKNCYPEIAVIDKQTIIIKPHIIENKN